MFMDVEIIPAKSLGESFREPSTTYPAGRKCTEKECGTVLSIYNPDDQCLKHLEGKIQARMRIWGKKYA